MSEETHVVDLLPAYALGSLDEPEAQQVAGHLAGCVLCRTELNAYQEVADQFVWMTPAASPPAGTWDRLTERLQSASRKRPIPERWQFPRRLLPVGGLVLLLIALLAVSNLLLWQRLQQLEVLRGPNGMRAITLQANEAYSRSSGFILIGANGMNGALVVDELPLLDEGHEYQLWLVRDGEHTSAAVFSVDESGYRGVRVQAPESLFEFSSVRITVEPAGGSAAPTGEEVMHASLFHP